MMKLRPAQEKIVAYENGRMAVSAVPGSGKTFTLAQLATKLLAQGWAAENPSLDPHNDQRVLIVTYLNASVDTFRARVRKNLEELNLPSDEGYDVRTLHSLALEIVRLSESGLGADSTDPAVTDDTQTSLIIGQALDIWIEAYPELWRTVSPSGSPREQARLRNTIQKTAKDFVRTAKNDRYTPEDILSRLNLDRETEPGTVTEAPPVESSIFLFILAGIYQNYQLILDRQGVLDFDDLIWRAAELLETRPDLAAGLRRRWPFVLEDEAQDSVPLQEVLLTALSGPDGSWVRVGDPNQAITSSFTAAHPRFFNAFIDREDVVALPLPNSGRSSGKIIGAANAVVDWVLDSHPIPEVRAHTFRRQHILPAPPGDAQPNPPDDESAIKIKVFKHREDVEIPAVARLAAQYAEDHPDHTLAILTPTHNMGYQVAEELDDIDAPYDNLLRGGTREREIAAALNAILAILADPQDGRALADALMSLNELEHPAASISEESLNRLDTVLRSVPPESFLFPWDETSFTAALPAGRVTDEEIAHLARFSRFLQDMFALRTLPVDDLALAIGDELLRGEDTRESDLAIAYQLAIVLRYWQEINPEWRLPDLSTELANLANGRRNIPLARPSTYGYEPQPGRITLAVQHGAKGLEWDAVFLMGIDGFWIPTDLDSQFLGVHEALGGDPTAEALAQLRYLMQGDAGLYQDLNATESAHIDVISERLRLLYVGITRARRYLHISRSRRQGRYEREKDSEPATVLGQLYEYLRKLKQ